MTEGKKLRKEKAPSYGLKSILLGTIIALALAYVVYYAAVIVNAKQPILGAIIAGSLFWIISTLGMFLLLNIMGRRKYRKERQN